ncbi:hypothetical protein ASD88_03225 [Pelomonas sp. Root662]|nr:hypothetical protein ASC81_03225 [Pelomonas sp. Root405]KRA77885.1 hypothetical protein ASD88_03225 [Pelomonas sp. Root662]
MSAAVRLLLLGVALLATPWLLGQSPLGSGLTVLRPLGWTMVVASALFFVLAFWGNRNARKAARPRVAPEPEPRRDPLLAEALPKLQQTQPVNPLVWSHVVFDAIEWRRFEAVVEALFQQAGFETRSQSHGADGGVDVWLYSRAVPDRPVSVVQCKHWQGRRVGVDKIRELRGVMAAHDVKRGQFATTSTFTPDAIAFARENSVNLLDVDALLALIAQRTPEQQMALLAVAHEGDYARPSCASCGSKLVERTAKNGGSRFWGCPGFPRCRTTLPMRSS